MPAGVDELTGGRLAVRDATKTILEDRFERYLKSLKIDDSNLLRPEIVFIDQMDSKEIAQMKKVWQQDYSVLGKQRGVWYEPTPHHRILVDLDGIIEKNGGYVIDGKRAWLQAGDAVQAWKLDDGDAFFKHTDTFLRTKARAKNVQHLAALGLDPAELKKYSSGYGKKVTKALKSIDSQGLFNPRAEIDSLEFQKRTLLNAKNEKGKKLAGALYDEVVGQQRIVTKNILRDNYEKYLKVRDLTPADVPMHFIDELNPEVARLHTGAMYYDADARQIFIDLDQIEKVRGAGVIDEDFAKLVVGEEIEHFIQHKEGLLTKHSRKFIEGQAWSRKSNTLTEKMGVHPEEVRRAAAELPNELGSQHPSKLEYLERTEKDLAQIEKKGLYDPEAHLKHPDYPGPASGKAPADIQELFREEDFLSKKVLTSERVDPVYRGVDYGTPDEIFRDGFTPRAKKPVSLPKHVLGQWPEPSSWISTTRDPAHAARFAGKDGYVFEMYQPGGIDIMDANRRYSPDKFIFWDGEKEVAYSRKIEGRYIKGAFKVGKDGKRGAFIANPAFDPTPPRVGAFSLPGAKTAQLGEAVSGWEIMKARIKNSKPAYFLKNMGDRLNRLTAGTGPAEDVLVYAGQFDPFHKTHQDELLGALKAFKGKKALVIPMRATQGVSAADRAPSWLRMLLAETAMKGDARVVVDSFALRRKIQGAPNLMAELADALGPKKNLTFLMGSDNFKNLKQWRNVQKFLAENNVLVNTDLSSGLKLIDPQSHLPKELADLYETTASGRLVHKKTGKWIDFEHIPTQRTSSWDVVSSIRSGDTEKLLTQLDPKSARLVTEHYYPFVDWTASERRFAIGKKTRGIFKRAFGDELGEVLARNPELISKLYETTGEGAENTRRVADQIFKTVRKEAKAFSKSPELYSQAVKFAEDAEYKALLKVYGRPTKIRTASIGVAKPIRNLLHPAKLPMADRLRHIIPQVEGRLIERFMMPEEGAKLKNIFKGGETVRVYIGVGPNVKIDDVRRSGLLSNYARKNGKVAAEAEIAKEGLRRSIFKHLRGQYSKSAMVSTTLSPSVAQKFASRGGHVIAADVPLTEGFFANDPAIWKGTIYNRSGNPYYHLHEFTMKEVQPKWIVDIQPVGDPNAGLAFKSKIKNALAASLRKLKGEVVSAQVDALLWSADVERKVQSIPVRGRQALEKTGRDIAGVPKRGAQSVKRSVVSTQLRGHRWAEGVKADAAAIPRGAKRALEKTGKNIAGLPRRGAHAVERNIVSAQLRSHRWVESVRQGIASAPRRAGRAIKNGVTGIRLRRAEARRVLEEARKAAHAEVVRLQGYEDARKVLEGHAFSLDDSILNPKNFSNKHLHRQLMEVASGEALEKAVRSHGEDLVAKNDKLLRSMGLTPEQIAEQGTLAMNPKKFDAKVRKLYDAIADHNIKVAKSKHPWWGWLRRKPKNTKAIDKTSRELLDFIRQNNPAFEKLAEKNWAKSIKADDWARGFLKDQGLEKVVHGLSPDVSDVAKTKGWKTKAAAGVKLRKSVPDFNQMADEAVESVWKEIKTQSYAMGATDSDLANLGYSKRNLKGIKKGLAGEFKKYHNSYVDYLSPAKIKAGDRQLKIRHRNEPKIKGIEKKIQKARDFFLKKEKQILKTARANRAAVRTGKGIGRLEKKIAQAHVQDPDFGARQAYQASADIPLKEDVVSVKQSTLEEFRPGVDQRPVGQTSLDDFTGSGARRPAGQTTLDDFAGGRLLGEDVTPKAEIRALEDARARLNDYILPTGKENINPKNFKQTYVYNDLKTRVDADALHDVVHSVEEDIVSLRKERLHAMGFEDEVIEAHQKWLPKTKKTQQRVQDIYNAIASHNAKVARANHPVYGRFFQEPKNTHKIDDAYKAFYADELKALEKFEAEKTKKFLDQWKGSEWVDGWMDKKGFKKEFLLWDPETAQEAAKANWRGKQALQGRMSHAVADHAAEADSLAQAFEGDLRAHFEEMGVPQGALDDIKIDPQKMKKAKLAYVEEAKKTSNAIDQYLEPGKLRLGDHQLKIRNKSMPGLKGQQKKIKEIQKVIFESFDENENISKAYREAVHRGELEKARAMDALDAMDADVRIYGGEPEGLGKFGMPGVEEAGIKTSVVDDLAELSDAGKMGGAPIDLALGDIPAGKLLKLRKLKAALAATKAGRVMGKLPLGPMDFIVTAGISPVMFKMGGGSERAGRLASMMAIENLTVEPIVMGVTRQWLLARQAAQAAKLGVKAAKAGLKATMGSMLPLLPLVIVETFVEDSVEEWFRTKELNDMGIQDVQGDALSVMGRTGEGWKDFAWNSSEERGIKTEGGFYTHLSNSYFSELEEKSKKELGRDLTDDESMLLLEEAQKRANRILPDRIGDGINELRKMKDAESARAYAETLANKVNQDEEFIRVAGMKITVDSILKMALLSHEEDVAYAASAQGMLFKGVTDSVYGGVRGLNQFLTPLGEDAAPGSRALQSGLIAAADFLAPVGAALSPGAEALQKHITAGLTAAGDALTPVGTALWAFGTEVGKHLSPITKPLAQGAMNLGGMLWNALGLAQGAEKIKEQGKLQSDLLLSAMSQDAAKQASEEIELQKEAQNSNQDEEISAPDCGAGWKAVWGGSGMGWSCARDSIPAPATPSKNIIQAPLKNPAKNSNTLTLTTEQIGDIQVRKKHVQCRAGLLLLETGVCIKDSQMFYWTGNKRVPYRGVKTCPPETTPHNENKPKFGAIVCRP